MTSITSTTGGSPRLTTVPLEDAAKSSAQIPERPEFIRLPKGGLCPWTGLSRSKMAQLVLPCRENDYRPPVRSVCLRRVGAVKGARLVPLQELLDFLYGQLEHAKPNTKGGAE